MKIEYWFELDVNEDGTLGDPVDPARGAVEIEPQIKTNFSPHYQTRTAFKNPWWMLVSTGRFNDGQIYGITLYFDSEQEMKDFYKSKKGIGVVCDSLP